MKKIFLLVLFIPLFSYAQQMNYSYWLEQESYNNWVQNEDLDEFGDPTGKTYNVFAGDGTFSNTHIAYSKLIVAVVDNNESIGMSFLEDGQFPIKTFNGKLGLVKVKRANGTVETHVALGGKRGVSLVFVRGSSFFELIRSGLNETIKISVDGENFGDDNYSEYDFTIRTQ